MLNGAIYVPPPVAEMRETLDAFERFLYAPTTLPPLIRLGLIHYQFEAIHPFLDGNGRVGRLLISLLLSSWNLLPEPLLYLSAYFEMHRQTYYGLLLATSQQGSWEAWLTFFLHGVATQAHDAVARARQLQSLQHDYRQRFQNARASARLLQVVDLLFAQPILTIRQVETALGINFAAAQRYMDQLTQAGLLREITGKARNRVYRADEVLRAIDEPLTRPEDDWLNDSEEQMQAEDAAWDASYARHRARFLTLREAARAEIATDSSTES